MLYVRCGFFFTNLLFDLDSLRNGVVGVVAAVDCLRSAGFGDNQVEGMVGMWAVMRPDFVPEDERSIITTTPTTLAAWAHAHLRPLLRADQAT